jgi:hypothetical protein
MWSSHFLVITQIYVLVYYDSDAIILNYNNNISVHNTFITSVVYLDLFMENAPLTSYTYSHLFTFLVWYKLISNNNLKKKVPWLPNLPHSLRAPLYYTHITWYVEERISGNRKHTKVYYTNTVRHIGPHADWWRFKISKHILCRDVCIARRLYKLHTFNMLCVCVWTRCSNTTR